MQLKTGMRLKSTVCDAEIMVINAPDVDVVLTCGGAPMSDSGEAGRGGAVDPAHQDGVQMGKRYVDGDGALEVLCIKPGAGSLAMDGTPLAEKSAKKIPKTD